MRVHIGTDHAGFELKNFMVAELTKAGYEVIDHGPQTYDAEDDYPAFCIAAGEAMMADAGSLAVVIGGSGTASRSPRTRFPASAALAYDVDTARLAREHNDANVISLGARMHTEDEALSLVKLFWRRRSAVRSGTPDGSPNSPTYEAQRRLIHRSPPRMTTTPRRPSTPEPADRPRRRPRTLLVLGVGPRHVTGPQGAIRCHEPGDSVTHRVARPELACVGTASRSTCHSDQPMASDLLNP